MCPRDKRTLTGVAPTASRPPAPAPSHVPLHRGYLRRDYPKTHARWLWSVSPVTWPRPGLYSWVQTRIISPFCDVVLIRRSKEIDAVLGFISREQWSGGSTTKRRQLWKEDQKWRIVGVRSVEEQGGDMHRSEISATKIGDTFHFTSKCYMWHTIDDFLFLFNCQMSDL